MWTGAWGHIAQGRSGSELGLPGLVAKVSAGPSGEPVSGGLSPHTLLPFFPGLIPEETPESSFLLEGDILRPVSEGRG